MKIFVVVASLFLSLNVIGQKSYYFSDPVPSAEKRIDNVNAKLFGEYTSPDGRIYSFEETGIYVISTSISSMSRTSIRESAQYNVINGYIHGVLKDDSIPCVLDGERYYFGVRNRDLLIGEGSNNVLTESANNSNEYFINMKEDGVYVPIRLTFQKKGLDISYFDYEFETEIFDGVENQKVIKNEFNDLVILSPTSDEFYQMAMEELFPKSVPLKRAK